MSWRVILLASSPVPPPRKSSFSDQVFLSSSVHATRLLLEWCFFLENQPVSILICQQFPSKPPFSLTNATPKFPLTLLQVRAFFQYIHFRCALTFLQLTLNSFPPFYFLILFFGLCSFCRPKMVLLFYQESRVSPVCLILFFFWTQV